MARKSRKNIDNTSLATEDVRLFSAAIYVRLSREEQEGSRNHASFKNQKAFLLDFVEKHPEITVYKIYEDNGYSGTNFDRPGFSDMMYDVSNEKVDCIIVKDLSRFGREHIETGKYLDYLFPMIGLRFIAVNDNYDTYDKIKDNDMIVPFKNIINAIYSKDIGRKVKSSFALKMKKGEFLGTYAPYGFLLDENRKLIIDPEASENVKRIFEMYANGESMLGICKTLTREGIDIPSVYKLKKGIIKKHAGGKDNVWKVTVLKNILSNYAYAGHMAQGKVESEFLKTGVKKLVKVPESQWVIVKNTHEGFISDDLFEKVLARIKAEYMPKAKPNANNIFKGKLYCGYCGSAMKINGSPTTKYLTESFLFSEAKRYDVKGKKYFEYPLKYYCTDIGLRNARLNFRQQEETHIMENIIYNELLARDYSVDVGVIEICERKDGKRVRKQCEIDFVVNFGSKKYYIQSALNVSDAKKLETEIRPFKHTNDFFKKILITKTSMKPWTDEDGILHLGLYEFLLNKNSLEL